MRGKDLGLDAEDFHLGITPACAGKSTLSLTDAAPVMDHPRVCGEKAAIPFSENLDMGSPPRVRGKEEPSRRKSEVQRITPACAGKSRRRF